MKPITVPVLLLSIAVAQPALAQIVPAADGTQTIVTPQGTRVDISGGQRSVDGANLFHSFTQFGLDATQTANFLATPNLQNILARVNGGSPSLIQGLLQVSGGNANLYLMNPAGIVFGQTASLNVPASFTATTATGIGFGNGWFNASGNGFDRLVGNPMAFSFANISPGSMVNAATLTAGKDLSLIGGTVLSLGGLLAPNGELQVVAVPGQNIVRLNPVGSPLSFEVYTGEIAPNGASIAQLLTGGTLSNATGVSIAADGTIQLMGAQVKPGDVAIAQSPLRSARSLTLFADNTVLIRDSVTTPFTAGSGADLTLQGNRGIDILALNHLDKTPFYSGGQLRLISDGVISADSHFKSDRGFSVLNRQGRSGTFVSYYDPIISVDGDVSLGNYQGVSLKIEATGKIETNSVTITGRDGFLCRGPSRCSSDALILSEQPAIIFRAGLSQLQERSLFSYAPSSLVPANPQAPTFTLVDSVPPADGSVVPKSSGDIRVNGGLITNAADSSIILDAANGNIEIDNILTGGGSITANASGLFKIGKFINSFGISGGSININANGNIEIANLVAGGLAGQVHGEIVLSTAGRVSLGMLTPTGANTIIKADSVTLPAAIPNTLGGNVRITTVQDLFTPALTTNGGDIQLSSTAGKVFTGFLWTNGSSGGNVAIAAANRITTDSINTQGKEQAGNVSLTAADNIVVDWILATPGLPQGKGGSVDIATERFFKATGAFAGASLATVNNSITIRHGGGPLRTPFEVGDAKANGTEGAIVAGKTPIKPTQSFLDSYTQGSAPDEIQLITAAPIIPPPNEIAPPDDTPTEGDDSILDMDDLDDLESASDDTFDLINDSIDVDFANEFQNMLGLGSGSVVTVSDTQAIAAEIESKTGTRPAFIYVNYIPTTSKSKDLLKVPSQPTDVIELILVTATGKPIRKAIYGATREKVNAIAQSYFMHITDRTSDEYLDPAQQLYDILIRPIEAELQTARINNLVFLLESGLRSLPIAALHDGNQFLIEKYSLGLMPSLSLTDTRYLDIKGSKLLAMGASEFSELSPLPAVPVELASITQMWQQGQSLLNEAFTVENLLKQRQQSAHRIIHLATHSEFKPGTPADSYIQFWNGKLRLNQIRGLGLNNPPVELLVLSACRTAFGDAQAELGFAGLAAQSGARSALASLWYVSDEGTLALMSRFYQQLSQQRISVKAEALRQAQIAMASGKTSGPDTEDFSHPYYWAAFTLIGNPW